MRKSMAAAFLSVGVLWLVGCRTGGSSATNQVPGDGVDDSAGENPSDGPVTVVEDGDVADFCVGPKSLTEVKAMAFAKWPATFKEGIATPSTIPSRDRVNVFTAGKGFPRIVSSLHANLLANGLWDGKTMITDESGATRLYNRFLQVGDDVSIDLFSASVRVEASSKWSQQDGKPIILLDYTQSTVTDQDRPIGAINGVVVPVIKAIRDEIRLVCQQTANGQRRRLYLGPTFLLPEEFLTPPARLVAARYEHEPILWFALEFTEDAAQ